MFEQLMQNDWFILLIVLVIPLALGIVAAYLYSARRKRAARVADGLEFLPSEIVKAGYMLMTLALAGGGITWMLTHHYFAGVGALIASMELARWYPAKVWFSPAGLAWSTPFTKDQMLWEEISCARKRVTFVKKIDDSFEIFRSSGQRLIIEQSAHPDALRMLAAISGELKRRGLAPSGMPEQSMLEWLHRALSVIAIGLLVYARFGKGH